MKNKIICGDALKELKKLPENSVDAIITDPPYGLGFMGKEWDTFKPEFIKEMMGKDKRPHTKIASQRRSNTAGTYDLSLSANTKFMLWWQQVATECLRVLKSGGYLLSFGGTRTYHRMTCGIEDAGFEIRDTIMWLYGSGFPKSLNIGKQIDKNYNKTSDELIKFGKLIREYRDNKGISQRELGKRIGVSRELINLYEIKGNIQQQFPTKELWLKIKEELKIPDEKDYIYEEMEREVIGKKPYTSPKSFPLPVVSDGSRFQDYFTKPATPEAKQWEGWGTALKPACEPIVVARKPLSEKNVALNVLKWGTGGINIDACRIEGVTPKRRADEKAFVPETDHKWGSITKRTEYDNQQGRFPANIILDEEAGKMLDEQSGELISGYFSEHHKQSGRSKDGIIISDNSFKTLPTQKQQLDKGGASRFFYCAKASKSERNFGLDDKQPIRYDDKLFGQSGGSQQALKEGKKEYLQKGHIGLNIIKKIKNNHPTVKPIKLMEYLIKLISREGAIILDPFIGSGTTAIACLKLNRKCIGIEKEEEYVKIAEARIKPFLEQTKL